MSSATILQIIPRLDTGGAELATVEMTAAVVRAGGRALVLSEGGRMAEAVARAGGELMDFPAATKNPFAIAANGLRLAHLAREQGVDLIHARSRAPAWSGLIAARRAGVPFVTTYHGAYGDNAPFKTLYNSIMARGDIVIANSRYTAGRIAALHRTPAERVRVIYRGVDLVAFDPAKVGAARLQALRLRWGIAPEQPIVLHAARLTPWKGQRVVVEAAGILKAQGMLGEAVFVLAGDAQGRHGYVSELERRIAELGLADRVRLVGHCADMVGAYLAAELVLVPSVEPEAFGRASAEALAMGRAVIASDLGATPEIVREGETGWLVPPGDAAALAGAVLRGLRRPPLMRQRMSEAARAHVVQNFSLARMRDETLAIYDELLRTALAPAYRAGAVRRTRHGGAAGAA